MTGTPGGMADKSPAAVHQLGPLLLGARLRARRRASAVRRTARKVTTRVSAARVAYSGIGRSSTATVAPGLGGAGTRCRESTRDVAAMRRTPGAGRRARPGGRRAAGGVERPGPGGGGGPRRRVGRGRRPGRAGPGGVEGAAVGGRGAGGLCSGTGAQLREAAAARGGGARPADDVRPATRPRGSGIVSGSGSTTRPKPDGDTGGGSPSGAERSESGRDGESCE